MGGRRKLTAFSLTETTFTDGEFGTIYRAFQFNGDECNPEDNAGNDLIGEIDARGHITQYTVDEETSRNEEVIDRLGNKTAYEYDAAGKTTKVTSKDAVGTEIANVSYGYDAFDNMTEIVRGDGMKYALKYNAFHNLESIGIDGKTDGDLIKYTYKNGNGRLKEMTYANGDRMTATYNGVGQMVAEKWYNSSNELTAHYKYVYDGEGNIVRSIDIKALKEYNYEYEEGKIIRATEADIVITNEIVTSKTVVNTIKYYYDSEGTMTKKVITSKDGSARTIYYEQTEDDNTVVKFTAGGKTVTSHSKTDSFGRKVFDELQLGTGFVSRQFQYHAGEVTDEHKENAKLKSSATTQLVSQIVLSNGTTLSYGYDAEERITSVVETYEADNVPVTNTTLYTYDALGQLVSETVNGQVKNIMTYDNYGNISTKNGVQYVYDQTWRDTLVSYNGQSITYDKQGNPISYLGNTLTWEKGRQLKSFGSNTYTYNANGIRTSKTVDGIRHNFELDGGIILKETWGNNTLIPLYDNEQSLCGIIYNNEPYYFQKNLQGDIIAITDNSGNTVAKYSYDAWGVPTVIQDTSNFQIATVNPFRYRGYYYDSEIGMYYLQSRYYNPTVGRFVNSDEAEFAVMQQGAVEHNLFAYCGNSAIISVDYTGYKPKNLQSYLKLKSGKYDKVKITINKNKIKIHVNFALIGDLVNKTLNGKKYCRLFADGIKKFWKGKFKVFGYSVTLETSVNLSILNLFANPLSYLFFNKVIAWMKNSYGVSNVTYLSGWKKSMPGYITMYKGDSRGTRHLYTADEFKRVSAHEFGHILGVGDLYKKEELWPKYSYENNYSMMGHQWLAKRINKHDLEKVLLAFKNNRKQEWI